MFPNIMLRTLLPANLLSEMLMATAGSQILFWVNPTDLPPGHQVVALHRMSEQDLSRTYLAHHELEVVVVVIITIIIVTITG